VYAQQLRVSLTYCTYCRNKKKRTNSKDIGKSPAICESSWAVVSQVKSSQAKSIYEPNVLNTMKNNRTTKSWR